MFHLYGMIIGTAIVIGYSVAEKIEPRVKEGAGYVIVSGIVGARIYHVLDFWAYYSTHLNEIFYLWNGGLSIWGAMIAGGIAVAIINHKYSDSQIWGALATALPLGQAIGRIGNEVNNEFTNLVLGIPWWGAEAILDLVLFAIIWGLTLRGVSSQVRVAVYLLGYGLIRYFLQPYRA